MQKRTAELLPCEYFHLVATVPSQLRGLFLREQKTLYAILMRTVAAALADLARDKRHVGAVPAIMAVLHTWTTQMHYHPHVHLLVSGGGLSDDGATWFPSAKGFLVPVRKLSSLISKRFRARLKRKRPDLFSQIPSCIWKKEWCSFCKPFGSGRDAVLRYLARYVFRIAITSNRILSVDQTHVTFRYKNNNSELWSTERVTGVEFIRRFLHVLPRGFHKVRYYGLWSAPQQARHHAARIQLQLLQLSGRHTPTQAPRLADLAEQALEQSEIENHAFVIKCPKCKSTNVRLLDRIRRGGMPMLD
jgi:hypothetical protein